MNDRLRRRILPILAVACILALAGCTEGPTIPARSWEWGVNTVLPNPDGTLADFVLLPAHREDFDLRRYFSPPDGESVTYEVAVTIIVNDGLNAVVFARIYHQHWLMVYSWSVLGEAEVTVTATGDGKYQESQTFTVWVVADDEDVEQVPLVPAQHWSPDGVPEDCCGCACGPRGCAWKTRGGGSCGAGEIVPGLCGCGHGRGGWWGRWGCDDE